PFADAVKRQDRRLLERRREERAGGVRLVMIGEDKLALVFVLQSLAHLAAEMELLLEPERQGFPKPAKSDGSKSEVRFEEPFKLGKGFVVEADIRKVVRPQPRLGQTIVDGVVREMEIVLPAREAFFLSGGNDFAVDDQRSRRIMVERR